MNYSDRLGDLLNEVGSLPTKPEEDMNKRIQESSPVDHNNINDVPMQSFGEEVININWGELESEEQLPVEVVKLDEDEETPDLSVLGLFGEPKADATVITIDIDEEEKSTTDATEEQQPKIKPFGLQESTPTTVAGINFETESVEKHEEQIHEIKINDEEQQPLDTPEVTVEPSYEVDEVNVVEQHKQPDDQIEILVTPPAQPSMAATPDQIMASIQQSVQGEMSGLHSLLNQVKAACSANLEGVKSEIKQAEVNQDIVSKYTEQPITTEQTTTQEPITTEQTSIQEPISTEQPSTQEQLSTPKLKLSKDQPQTSEYITQQPQQKDVFDLPDLPTELPVDNEVENLDELKQVEEVLELTGDQTIEQEEQPTDERLETLVDDIMTKTQVPVQDEQNQIKEIVKQINETIEEFSIEENLDKLNLSDITKSLLEEHYKNKEVIEVTSDIIKDIPTSSNNANSQQQHHELKTNILDINKSLAAISDKLKNSIEHSISARKIEKDLVDNLVETGLYYVEGEYTEVDLLSSNISVLETKSPTGETKYTYFYEDIPEHLTGYRTPLTQFIAKLEEGILNEVVRGKTLEMNLMDDNNMYILTKSELNTILHFIVDNKLSYNISNSTLYIQIM